MLDVCVCDKQSLWANASMLVVGYLSTGSRCPLLIMVSSVRVVFNTMELSWVPRAPSSMNTVRTDLSMWPGMM